MGDRAYSSLRVEPIDGLRGIAALGVAWFHTYGQNGGAPLADAMPTLLNTASVWGRFGVQLFFAISGFVITYRLFNDRSISRARDVGTYFIRRSVRLDPTYWLALACYLVAVPLVIRLGAPADIFPPQDTNAYEIVANIFYFLPFGELLYVPVAWSLIVEVQFYFALALLVLLLNRLEATGWSRDRAAFWIGLGLLLVAEVHMFSLPAKAIPGISLYHYLFNFLGGIFAALVYLRVPRAKLLFAIHFGAMLVAFALNRNSYVLASLTSAMIIALALAWEPLRRSLGSPTLLYLGALSYCIYLFHPLIGGLAIETLQTVVSREPGAHQLAFVVVGMLATIGFSAIVYRWIERPSIEASKWFGPRRADDPNVAAGVDGRIRRAAT